MVGGLVDVVEVVTLFAGAGFTVGPEQFLELVETVGLRAEVAEMLFGHLDLHLGAVVAMEAVAFDDGGVDAFAGEDMLEGTFDGGGSGAGRAGYCHDGM